MEVLQGDVSETRGSFTRRRIWKMIFSSTAAPEEKNNNTLDPVVEEAVV